MISNPKQINLALSPVLYPYHTLEDSIVVMVDAVRASASICTAFINGAEKVLPLADKDEALRQREINNYLIAGERNALKLPGFDFGNSPYDFMDNRVKGSTIAFSTTNGTKAIRVAASTPIGEKGVIPRIIIGSFINIDAVADFLMAEQKPVVVLCSAWKNTPNAEDTLFAGMLAQKLIKSEAFYPWRDSVNMAIMLYQAGAGDLFGHLMQLSPRLKGKLALLEKDIRYCLTINQTEIIPEYKDGFLYANSR